MGGRVGMDKGSNRIGYNETDSDWMDTMRHLASSGTVLAEYRDKLEVTRAASQLRNRGGPYLAHPSICGSTFPSLLPIPPPPPPQSPP